MFNHFFLNTRSSLDRIHRQLKLLSALISYTTSLLFIGYYIYLIVVNVNHIGFLITYIILLVITVAATVINAFLRFRNPTNRKEKRHNLEVRRKVGYFFTILRICLKLIVIILSGIELVKYNASEMQIITFTLSITLFIFYVSFNTLIYIINKDIDIIRLSIETDIKQSKILSKLMGEKEYTTQEKGIIENIKDKAFNFLNRK